MSTRQKSSLAQLLGRQRGAQYASEEAQTADEGQSTPFFDQVVAGASGAETFEAVLTKITGPVDPATIPQFPTAQCLTPEQVYAIDVVGAEQQAHLSSCPWCKNMVAAAQPSNEEFAEILAKRGKATPAAETQRSRETAAY